MELEWVRDFCLGFHGATEQVQWGNNLVLKVGGKMFAVLALEPAATVLAFKCSAEGYAELTETPGCIPAPYLARAQWIALESEDALSTSRLKELLRSAYEIVVSRLPKKTRDQLGAQKIS